MVSDWLEDLHNGKLAFSDDNCADFYCPYTNGAECALNTSKPKPRELCEAIECGQLKYYTKRHRQQHKMQH